MAVKRGLGRGLDAMIPNRVEEKKKEEKKKEEKKAQKEIENTNVEEKFSSEIESNGALKTTENREKVADKGENKFNPEKIIEEKIVEVVSYDTLKVSINDIDPNKAQPRKNFDEDALLELAESMKQVGVIQPLVVQKKGDRYEIITGERRWRAARIAGLREVPVVVKEYSAQEIFEIALIENIQREDLNPIEEAQAYQRLIQDYGLKQDEAAEKVGKSRVAVTNSMRLLKLDARVQQMVIDEMLTGGHARALLPIEDPELQYNTAVRVFDEKLSVRETERLVKRLQEEKPEKEEIKADDSYVYQEIEERMKQIVGSKVAIKRKTNNKGRIEIEYYSNDELERIIELFDKLGR